MYFSSSERDHPDSLPANSPPLPWKSTLFTRLAVGETPVNQSITQLDDQRDPNNFHSLNEDNLLSPLYCTCLKNVE